MAGSKCVGSRPRKWLPSGLGANTFGAASCSRLDTFDAAKTDKIEMIPCAHSGDVSLGVCMTAVDNQGR